MFDDFDNFSMDLPDDSPESMLETAKMTAIEAIDVLTQRIKENIQFREEKDAKNNIVSLSNSVATLFSLYKIGNSSDLTDEELNELIEAAKRSTSELSFDEIENVLGPVEETNEIEDTDDTPDDPDF